MKAIILAAGFGTRLFPLTIDRTKPAIPFLGKPLVGYVAEYISGHGITDVVVNLHHQPNSVMAALGDGSAFGTRISYSHEIPEILGTAGALDNAREHLEDDTFLIVNGKIVTDIDIEAALRTHKETGAIATMVLMENGSRERFTEVLVEEGRVTGFGDFAEKNGTGPAPLMFTGIHILEPEAFEYIPRGVYSDIVPTFYNPAIRDGKTVAAHVTEGKWYELSTIDRYLDISLAMLNGSADRNIVGDNCSISESADVSESIVWDNVTIEPGASVRRCVIGDGVTIGADEAFEEVAIVTREILEHCEEIPAKATKGEYVGDNYVVPLTRP